MLRCFRSPFLLYKYLPRTPYIFFLSYSFSLFRLLAACMSITLLMLSVVRTLVATISLVSRSFCFFSLCLLVLDHCSVETTPVLVEVAGWVFIVFSVDNKEPTK